MHLKTLTLRGFKSFASATTLSFEPGVTCVVGPNGSGKSNVVDALAWVMGEQGAKTLRGGKMEDVIFAGTSGRPPLGRAEVSLTIDNTDGALPIEYAEVTITRTLFRNGGSEYAINGSSCRLLDIQDLLSDSGLGREMHVIVGQGQLDAVLRATPEERRGFIEEAAGVLKHRKRKDKALRKLEAMSGNLLRLGDLTAELRRQLGPLGRQAEMARKAAVVAADLRDAKARLLADDLAQLTASLDQEIADESALRARAAEAEATLAGRRTELDVVEHQITTAGPAVAEANATWYALGSLRDRLTGTRTLAAERLRLLSAEGPPHQGQDPRELDAQAVRARAADAELAIEVAGRVAWLTELAGARLEAEAATAAAEKALAAATRGVADRREGLARLAGQVAARRSTAEATEAEIGRLRASLDAAQERGVAARGEFEALETQVAGAAQGEEDLDADHEDAVAALHTATESLREVLGEREEAERDRATWLTRAETLDLSLTRKDGAGALLAADSLTGTIGSMAALLSIEPGYADAVAAALGPHADAVAVNSADAAVDAIRLLRADDAGRASLVIGDNSAGANSAHDDSAHDESADNSSGHGSRTGDHTSAHGEWASAPGVMPPGVGVRLPDGAVWAAAVVRPAASVRRAVDRLLAGVVVVDDLVAAQHLVGEHPELTAVTRTGDVLGAHRAWGGSAAAPSVLHLQAALDEARAAQADAEQRLARAHDARVAAVETEGAARRRHDLTVARLNESDAAIAAVAEQLGALGATTRAAVEESVRIQDRLDAAERALAREREGLAELTDRLEVAQTAPEESEEAVARGTADRDRASERAVQARSLETEARLALRTSEERARAVSGRAQGLERAAVTERAARERAAQRQTRRLRQTARARAVREGADATLTHVEQSIARAAARRDDAEAARVAREAQRTALRATVDALTADLRELTDTAHRDEVARAQQQLRVETLEVRAVDELGLDPVTLIEEFGPHRMIPVLGAADDEPGGQPDDHSGDSPDCYPTVEPAGRPYVRAEQEKRLRTAERAMTALGKVNPLALEEFAALEERHKFLTDQLSDLKRSRADLMELVREIDERVEQVFSEAYRDTEAQFAEVFPRLFPGGEGRLVLTDPGNMLTTGIEIEARPAGKKVKRLSLLSGGERSLTAIALLVSIFKARPSPFYVMDEVEAALDDTNLGRLLDIFMELQQDSQLIVITHQKRTMEIADALYGVTMRGDGVTTVISQRMREPSQA
ncbi:AAA family ATPase [Sanguibacter gelidistatuariae]|uniref:AAA family ATPase n=1 Tax=Sanguibacter gelidistatuariae TaxID=1814289 RepID=UPI000B850F33|nr:AAA family ATPase [Sanguibacter gelidistatuariae]